MAIKHDPPKNLTPDGERRYGAEDYDFECFMLFWYFGEAVNRDLGDSPFKIQEISDTNISGDLSSEGPAYGRRYEIFYNQVKLGLLQIMASHHRHFDKQDQSVYAHATLDGAPITALPYATLYGFLQTNRGLSHQHRQETV
jgi:hypothetical protein